MCPVSDALILFIDLLPIVSLERATPRNSRNAEPEPARSTQITLTATPGY
ncbi:MAG: hypothetical protein LH609_11735 [Rudanella sp.]|nr:hypothetical protein [Rudanella sp.]